MKGKELIITGSPILLFLFQWKNENVDRGTHYGYGTAILLVENINSSSLLEIQDNNSVSGSAYKNLSE